jgi:hypothetical protein
MKAGFVAKKVAFGQDFVSSIPSHYPVKSFHHFSIFIHSYISYGNVLVYVYSRSQTISIAGSVPNITAKGQRPKSTSCTQMWAICSHSTEAETWPRTAAKRRKSSLGKMTLPLTRMKWLLLLCKGVAWTRERVEEWGRQLWVQTWRRIVHLFLR